MPGIKASTGSLLDIDLIKDKKIYVATPMYDGKCTCIYNFSMIKLFVLFEKLGMSCNFDFVYNESLISRARNTLVDNFINSNYDYLMFIDSDIGFDPENVLDLIYWSEKENIEIIGGVYPGKKIKTNLLKKLINNFSSERALSSSYPYPVKITNSSKIKEDVLKNLPIEVKETTTGFLLISKNVFLKIKESYPEKKYIQNKTFKPMFAYFDHKIDKNGYYLSEDYYFCELATSIGIKPYILPWINLDHSGFYIFRGSYLNHVIDV
jgi:hypothetical protein